MSLKDIVNDLRNPTVITTDIDAVLREQNKNKQVPLKYFRPSSVPYQCPVEMWYSRRGVKYSNPANAFTPDPKLTRLFQLGTDIHEDLQRWLAKTDRLLGLWKCPFCKELFSEEPSLLPKDDVCSCKVAQEKCGTGRFREHFNWKYEEMTLISDEYDIIGHCDGVIKDGAEDILLEIKSINTYQFGKLREPSIGYLEQATIYAWLLGLKKILFLYYDKNNSELKEFLVDRREETIEPVKKKIKNVQGYLKSGEKMNTHENRICKVDFEARANDCPYKDVCFEKKEEILLEN